MDSSKKSEHLSNKNTKLNSTEYCKRMFLMYQESFSCLDEDDTLNFLYNGLKEYHKLLAPEIPVFDTKIQLRTNISKLNIADKLKLSCSNNVTCVQSEQALRTDFNEFLKVFDRKNSFSVENKSAKMSNLPINRNKSAEIHQPKGSYFRTASEELYAQNPNMVQKKRLGTRGGSTKFKSPMLAANNSSDSKFEETPPLVEIDERLKNIDPKMIELIKSEIMDCGNPIHWNDIAGLEFAKSAIQEAVIWPMLRPDIFTGLRRPPKGILLFGPPGTGKTLIGKCIASQSKSTFFSISASSLTSKWIGDGEKMVRALFAVARCHQPSVIFIDEIDSLLSQRSDSEHESSRRIKTEFLVQLDGASTDNEERILLVGATNRPQELDEAARRRFVKRLYIPLPEYEARVELLKKLVNGENHSLNVDDFNEIGKQTDGYSGADIRNLCAEASLGPIRSISMSQIERIQATEVRALNMDDFLKALQRVKSSVSSKDLEHYISWDKTFGSGI